MIYFDNNASTPVLKAVIDKMLPCFDQFYGNASSKTHAMGWQADELVKKARMQVAQAIGAEESEVYFTSGATESIYLALKIIADSYASKGKHIISCKTEHKAMLDGLKVLEKSGFEITLLDVNSNGEISLDELSLSIRPDTIAISLMHANNETGVIHPIDKIGEICKDRNIVFLSDCTQSLGKIELNMKTNQLGLACFSGHKLHGPKGVGILFVSRKNPRVQLNQTLISGAHENGLRSGTLNVPGIVGLGEAAEFTTKNLIHNNSLLSKLRDSFEWQLKAILPISINAENTLRLPNTSNVFFHEINNTTIIKLLPEIAFSTGSACMSALPEPSHVLNAMGINSNNSARFSFGLMNSQAEIKLALKLIKERLGTK